MWTFANVHSPVLQHTADMALFLSNSGWQLLVVAAARHGGRQGGVVPRNFHLLYDTK